MWGGFCFWTVFRFALGLLAHFNWLAAFKIRCVYVICWKTYDLLWFWMHLILCICFPALRRENFKVIWWNLLTKKLTTHRAYALSEIYLMIYGKGNATISEVALERIDTAEKKELKERALRRSMRQSTKKRMKEVMAITQSRHAHSSDSSSTDDEVEALLQKGLPDKTGWKAANIRSAIGAKMKDFKSKAESALLLDKQEQPGPSTSPEPKKEEEIDIAETDTWGKMKGIVQKVASPRTKRAAQQKEPIDIEEADPVPVHILTADFSNEFDLKNPKRKSKRERKDKRELRKRVRERVRRELEERAEEEKRRKVFTDAIDLLLQMLRMVTMFAMVTWNVRKHNPLAAFKHLEIDFDPDSDDQESRDLQAQNFSSDWVIALSITVFLDVAGSILQFFMAYYQQWQLFFRMGWCKSIVWTSALVSITLFVMLIPMSHVLESLDLSWCRVLPHTEVACFAPPLWVDFPYDDPRLQCNWWLALDEGGHRSPGNYSDFADHTEYTRRFFFF